MRDKKRWFWVSSAMIHVGIGGSGRVVGSQPQGDIGFWRIRLGIRILPVRHDQA